MSIMPNKRTADAYKAGDEYTKLSKRFQASGTGVRITKKFKEIHTAQNEPGRGQTQRLSKKDN